MGWQAWLQAGTGFVIFSGGCLAVGTALVSKSQMVATSCGWQQGHGAGRRLCPAQQIHALTLAAGRPDAEASGVSLALDV